MKNKEEWRVFIVGLEELPTKPANKITDQAFIKLARKYGEEYTLKEFEEIVNNDCPLTNYWIRITKIKIN
jgi:hypothetical protein